LAERAAEFAWRIGAKPADGAGRARGQFRPRAAQCIPAGRGEAQGIVITEQLARVAKLDVDLAHDRVDGLLAHLRQPNQDRFLVDARTVQTAGERA